MNQARSAAPLFRLTIAGLLAGPAVAGAGEPPRIVVLVTIDTLRADHLGCYGYERPTSPFLDRLAREGVARLFSSMEARHLNERALWIVTADHGEGLGNQGWLDHVRLLYNEAVRVPLIVYANGRWAGSRVLELVRHVDVMPTLLDLVGLPFAQPGYTPAGRSILEGGTKTPAMAFSVRRPWGKDHRDWERGEVFALQDLDWKYIAHTQGRDELFDLRGDPLELWNLVDTGSPVRPLLESLTRKTFASLQREGSNAPTQGEPAASEELKALGYVR
jgi:arylsulfatase A-like enzyme